MARDCELFANCKIPLSLTLSRRGRGKKYSLSIPSPGRGGEAIEQSPGVRSNRKAAILSGLVCPGLGQFFKKEKAKGAIIVSLITIDLLWLFVRIMKLVWRTVAVAGPGGIEAMKLDPRTMAGLHRAAWVQNWWLLAIFVAIWLYAIIDAAYSKNTA